MWRSSLRVKNLRSSLKLWHWNKGYGDHIEIKVKVP